MVSPRSKQIQLLLTCPLARKPGKQVVTFWDYGCLNHKTTPMDLQPRPTFMVIAMDLQPRPTFMVIALAASCQVSNIPNSRCELRALQSRVVKTTHFPKYPKNQELGRINIFNLSVVVNNRCIDGHMILRVQKTNGRT